MSISVEQLIQSLKLEPHVEGGYFKRIYEANHRPAITTERGSRLLLSCIHYLLTKQSPTGHWHLNQSDIVHFFQLGDPIDYYLIHPSGELETVTLGPNPTLDHHLQLTVKGGIWKASHLAGGHYGLISEAVSPGFDYADMTLATRQELIDQFPQHQAVITRFTR